MVGVPRGRKIRVWIVGKVETKDGNRGGEGGNIGIVSLPGGESVGGLSNCRLGFAFL